MRHNDDTFHTEHWLSWALLALAGLLGVIGLLEALNEINFGRSLVNVDPVGNLGSDDSDAAVFRDGALFLMAAIISAVLAWTLHRSEHHVARDSYEYGATSTNERHSHR